jgi:hypothetical protein
VRAAWLAALLLMAPAAAAVEVELAVPGRLALGEAVFLSGHVAMPGSEWTRLRATTVSGLEVPQARVTVCPIGPGTNASALELLLATVYECPGGDVFHDARFRFGPGTDLAFGGLLGMEREPDASLAVPIGDGNGTLLLVPSADGARWRLENGSAAFAPTTRGSSITVTGKEGTATYGGTGFLFRAEGRSLELRAAGFAARLPGELRLAVGPAAPGTLESAIRPFELLDLEEAAAGPDAREPRGNVSGVLREYGRVAAFLDGAAAGRLEGAVGGVALDGGLALARGTFELRREDGFLRGTGSPQAVIASGAVALDGSGLVGAPWPWVVAILVLCAAVLLLRRAAPSRTLPMRLAWVAAVVLSLAAVDRFLLEAAFGTSAAGAVRAGAPAGTVLALAAFEAVVVAASFLLLALPVRLVLGRVVPARFLLVAEGAWAAVWAFLPALFPAAFFALGYTFARL